MGPGTFIAPHAALEPITSVYTANRHPKWHRAAFYAVQVKRGGPAIAYICIDEIRYVDCAWNISAEDARAEGFDSEAAWRKVYTEANGGSIHVLDEPCWALTFHLIERVDP